MNLEAGKCWSWQRAGLKTGMCFLDQILSYDSGIITIRASDPQFLFSLAANMIVRNHDASRTQDSGPKTIYLHWVDYHRRYWTLDHDLLMKIAKSTSSDFASISRNLYFVRAFTRDNIEVEENWEMISGFAENVNLVILDSISELYETDRNGNQRANLPINSKTMAYSIGRFVRICMKNSCPGIVLDHAKMPVHPYLGEVSSVIVEFSSDGALIARILKHPCIRESSFIINSGNQRTMRSWI